MIHGQPPGYMVGELGPKKRWDSEFIPCPICGDQMHKTSELCHGCRVKHNNRFGPIDPAGKIERDQRVLLAEQAGWSLTELLELARQDKFPSRGKILCKRWWNVTAR